MVATVDFFLNWFLFCPNCFEVVFFKLATSLIKLDAALIFSSIKIVEFLDTKIDF